MIGDIDPIKAARRGQDISDELTVHYGLLPRANRGIFAINELPDLAGKIQVGLFNIMQEGDVQIKGYPVRLPLDLHAGVHGQSGGLHRARQDHHAAQGSHRQRDSHALSGDVEHGLAITEQEAWTGARTRRSSCEVPRLHSRNRRAAGVSRRAKTSAWTSAPAYRSGCRFRCSRTWFRTRSGGR